MALILHQNVGQKQKKFVAPKRQPGVVWARLGATKKIEKNSPGGRRNSATFGPWEGNGEGWKMLGYQGSAGVSPDARRDGPGYDVPVQQTTLRTLFLEGNPMKNTSNLGLPQWEATDPVQRADFNDAFQALDEGYSTALDLAAAPPSAVGVLDLTAASAGDVVVTFDFTPAAIIMWGDATYVGVGLEGKTFKVNNTATGASNLGYRIFTFQGPTLTLTESYNRAPDTVYYVAVK
jgi:hypothetical protein